VEETQIPEVETLPEAAKDAGESMEESRHAAELEGRVGQLEQSLHERDGEIAQLRSRLAIGAAKYRQAMLASAPEVPEELVQGESIEEVETSLARAKGIVERIRGQLEARMVSERVPAGAPPRTAPDLSSLSPAEKIAYGLQRAAR